MRTRRIRSQAATSATVAITKIRTPANAEKRSITTIAEPPPGAPNVTSCDSSTARLISGAGASGFWAASCATAVSTSASRSSTRSHCQIDAPAASTRESHATPIHNRRGKSRATAAMSTSRAPTSSTISGRIERYAMLPTTRLPPVRPQLPRPGVRSPGRRSRFGARSGPGSASTDGSIRSSAGFG